VTGDDHGLPATTTTTTTTTTTDVEAESGLVKQPPTTPPEPT
jgi:hypothetical protein